MIFVLQDSSWDDIRGGRLPTGVGCGNDLDGVGFGYECWIEVVLCIQPPFCFSQVKSVESKLYYVLNHPSSAFLKWRALNRTISNFRFKKAWERSIYIWHHKPTHTHKPRNFHMKVKKTRPWLSLSLSLSWETKKKRRDVPPWRKWTCVFLRIADSWEVMYERLDPQRFHNDQETNDRNRPFVNFFVSSLYFVTTKDSFRDI